MVKAGYRAYGVRIMVAGKEKGYGMMESSFYLDMVKRGNPPTKWTDARLWHSWRLGRRDELQRAEVAPNGPVAVNIDSAIPELVPAWARGAVARIDRRALGEQRNVLVTWEVVVVHKHAQPWIADEIGRGQIDSAACGIPNDVIAERDDWSVGSPEVTR
jgi:hypothetical protein